MDEVNFELLENATNLHQAILEYERLFTLFTSAGGAVDSVFTPEMQTALFGYSQNICDMADSISGINSSLSKFTPNPK